MRTICLILIAVFALGCQTLDVITGADSDVIGEPVAELIAQAKGQRIEIYNADGKMVPQVPEGERGSVSIFAQDGKSQDNYTFEEDGHVSKHMRSAGDDFLKSQWKTVAKE
jgi:hypothetical protein